MDANHNINQLSQIYSGRYLAVSFCVIKCLNKTLHPFDDMTKINRFTKNISKSKKSGHFTTGYPSEGLVVTLSINVSQ